MTANNTNRLLVELNNGQDTLLGRDVDRVAAGIAEAEAGEPAVAWEDLRRQLLRRVQ